MKWRRAFACLPTAVLGTVVGLVAFTATPALAAEGGGAGTGTTSFTVNAQKSGPPPCADVSATYTGTWTGVYTDGTRTYAGPLTATLSYRAFANPAGTFTDFSCTVPGAAAATGTSSGSNATQSVSCSYAGTFQRVGQNTVANLTGTCTITVTGLGSSTTPTSEVRMGVLVSCTGGPPPSSCASVDQYTAVPI